MMRILVLSQYFDPEPIPKPGELARSLRDRGHDVQVLTGLPNYPTGRMQNGYRLSMLHRERRDEVPVLRAFEYPYHGKRFLGRLFNYGSFLLSAPFASFLLKPIDVIYVWHPPLTVGLAAWIVARLRGAPFIYDVQDIWPESAVLSGMLRPGLVVKMLSILERFVYKRASHIIVVTEGARANVIGKGVAPEKVSVMPHWVDEEIFSIPSEIEDVRRDHSWEGRLVLLFAGNLGIVQGLETAIAAMERLRSSRPEALLVLIGDGADETRLKEMVRTKGLEDHVQFLPRRPMSEIPILLLNADVLLVHLKRSQLSEYIIPTKTVAYMAVGKPILMAMDGAAADLVREAGAGLTTPSEDPEALADAIEFFAELPPDKLKEFGSRGRSYFEANLSRTKVVSRYESLLEEVRENAPQRKRRS